MTMILYDIKKLERKLMDGEVSDKEGYNYLLVSMVLLTLISSLGSEDYGNKWVLLIEVVISLFFTVAAMEVSFDLNSKGDKKDYFKRYISLSFVSGVRLIVFGLIGAIPIATFMIFVERSFLGDQLNKDISDLFLVIIFGIAYYFIFTNSFRRIHPKTI